VKKLNKGSAGQNRKASQDFLDKFRQKDAVIECPSGLLYRVIEEGAGPTVHEQDSVVVNQRILNFDGRVIEDNYKTGVPDRFDLKEAISGLREALLLMSEGSRFEIAVPPELAWGKRGAANKIGPNAALFFDVRLLRIEF
jgi:FKBP-type peptidyl-prolyl cis-trans isomerase FkpA